MSSRVARRVEPARAGSATCCEAISPLFQAKNHSIGDANRKPRARFSGAKPDWRPLAAFDDGQQVFIEMPEKIHTMEAPPLFVIGDQGAELVNYRVQGNYYVVDRLFAKAELRLGSGWGAKVVTIERQTPISATRAANTTGARNG